MSKRFYVSKGKIRDKQKPNDWFTVKEVCALLNKQEDLIKRQNEELNNLTEENEQLKKENKRMANKLNELAFEFLNHDMVSMGKATEMCEMSYHDFLKYRAEHGNPMELQL